MRLSAAIRIGSMTTKHIVGLTNDGGNGRCAIGAAMDAVGATANQFYAWPVESKKLFPILRLSVAHPFTSEAVDLQRCIWLLNDRDHCTREEIADFVEKIEQEHDGHLQTGVTESKPLELIAQERI